MINRIFPSFFLLLLLFSFFTAPVLARLGVGVGTGKIIVDDKLKPGVIYKLPSLNVLNTGDEESDYSVTVTYHEAQTELMPDESWFVFSPERFTLKPGEIQEVSVKLNLPIRTEPGDYFAYLEAYPLTKVEEGTTQIGIAAAAKLYFTVIPGNFFEGIYYKLLSFWNIYAPWPQVGVMVIGAVGVLLLFKRFFNIQISTKKHLEEGKANEKSSNIPPKEISKSRRSRLKR